MSSKSDATKKFTANMKVTVLTEVPLRAKSYADAIVEAHELKERDIVEFSTDFLDGKIEVECVRDSSVEWPS